VHSLNPLRRDFFLSGAPEEIAANGSGIAGASRVPNDFGSEEGQ
jgi:hypothetical protein